MAIKLIVGLRNPGAAYEDTRHNAGAWFVEALSRSHNAPFQLEKKLHASLANVTLEHSPCKMMLACCFMNQSGMAVRAVSQFYRIAAEEILVAHDELDLACGRIKLKSDGGNGGHNGLRDITAQLGTSAFHRLRIGIGHPGHKDMVINYVLQKPRKEERELIQEAIERGQEQMPLIVSGNIMNAMSLLNK